METIQFKTNINCSGCVAKVTPVLNEVAGKDNWKVDIEKPGKVLTVSASSLDEKKIKAAVEKAGFVMERIGKSPVSSLQL